MYPEINFDMYPSDIESTYQLLSKIHQTFTETTHPISKEDYTQKINNYPRLIKLYFLFWTYN